MIQRLTIGALLCVGLPTLQQARHEGEQQNEKALSPAENTQRPQPPRQEAARDISGRRIDGRLGRGTVLGFGAVGGAQSG